MREHIFLFGENQWWKSYEKNGLRNEENELWKNERNHHDNLEINQPYETITTLEGNETNENMNLNLDLDLNDDNDMNKMDDFIPENKQ